MRSTLALLVLFLPFVPVLALAAESAPAQDDGAITAVVKRVEAVAKGADASIVTVEVRNDGSSFVEPLTFRIVPAEGLGDPLEVGRVLAPSSDRVGRTVAPRKRERYPLAIPRSAASLAGATVEVLGSATWEKGDRALDVKLGARSVQVGKPEVHEDDAIVRTTLPVTNRTDLPLDVTLEATFQNEGGGTCLVPVTLAPGEARTVEVRAIHATLDGAVVLHAGARVSRVKVVDWCARVDGGGAGAAYMQVAWDAWGRVPVDRLPLRATFHAKIDHRGLFRQGGRFDIVTEIDGRLSVDADGRILVTGLDGEALDVEGSSVAQRAVEQALWWITRPDFASISTGWELDLVEDGRAPIVRVSGASEAFEMGTVDVRLERDAIAAVASQDRLDTRAKVWTTKTKRGTWFVESTHQDLGQQGVRDREATYDEVDGVHVLATWKDFDESRLTKSPRTTELAFADWEFDTAAPEGPPPPTGPLADRLRAAWDGFYRYPDPRVELLGSYEMSIAGGDGVWVGRSKVDGTFSLRHFDNGYWRHTTVTTDDSRADEDTRAALISAVEDRIGMWSGRVPVWRPRFDEQFAGTELAEGEGRGWIRIEGHPRLAGVLLEGTRVAAIRFASGLLTRYRWREPKRGILLPVRVERLGNGNVDLEWKEVAPGWWFPRRAHFTEIFGPDWGPETLELDVDAVQALRSD